MIVWQAHRSKIRSLSFSTDGRLIATTAWERKTVSLWDARTGALVCETSPAEQPTRVVAFLPDGKHVVALLKRFGCSVWEIATGREVAKLVPDTWYGADAMAVAPTDGRVAIHTQLGLGEWFDPARLTTEPRVCDRDRPLTLSLLYFPVRLAYSPAGSYLCLLERNLTLLDPDRLRVVRTFVDRGGASASEVAFTPDETRLVVAFGRRALAWRLNRIEDRPLSLLGHSLLVRAVGFLPGGETILTAGMDGTARVWDANTGEQRRVFDWGIGKVRVAAVSPDGLTCAAGGDSGQIVMWDVDS